MPQRTNLTWASRGLLGLALIIIVVALITDLPWLVFVSLLCVAIGTILWGLDQE